MDRRAVVATALLVSWAFSQGVQGQRVSTPSDVELAAISERGRALAAYDQAAWHATDAVQMANPKTVEGQHYLAELENGKWTVVFGALSADKTKFFIHYEAVQGDKPQQYNVVHHDPPKEDTGFYLNADRALEIARDDLGQVPRPYSIAVLPAASGQFFVYLYPAPLKAGIFPLGGDARYLVSADGNTILEKRQLHKTIIESAPAKGKTVAAGYHTHVLSDVPEDTDVLHVLQQDPPVPEFVSTGHFLYDIAADGSIQVKKSRKN